MPLNKDQVYHFLFILFNRTALLPQAHKVMSGGINPLGLLLLIALHYGSEWYILENARLNFTLLPLVTYVAISILNKPRWDKFIWAYIAFSLLAVIVVSQSSMIFYTMTIRPILSMTVPGGFLVEMVSNKS